MSIRTDIMSPNKKELADLLRAIARLIEVSSNQTVTVTATITFNPCEEAEG